MCYNRCRVGCLFSIYVDHAPKSPADTSLYTAEIFITSLMREAASIPRKLRYTRPRQPSHLLPDACGSFDTR